MTPDLMNFLSFFFEASKTVVLWWLLFSLTASFIFWTIVAGGSGK